MKFAGTHPLLPWTWGRINASREAVQRGDSNAEFADSPTGSYLRKINEQQRILKEMGY